ncbi:transcriptional regulator [Pseudomonas parakoreensis]|uniref:transcriptional regulator n=1 Tax=Pseudomonas parakoreensis TaxID=2892331 RepID=UPI001F47EB8D|nr:Cro/CI family transcriptional regulator [Pseudomonas parakoreensis]
MGTIIEELVRYFGTQQKTATALNIDQTTVSGWIRGKHSVSPKIAARIESVTKGAFRRSALCPDFPWGSELDHPPTLNANVRPISAAGQSTVGAGVLSSTQQATP